ncbi:MAG: hypothetical protein AAFP92_08530 [Bacteroidota bacterium]
MAVCLHVPGKTGFDDQVRNNPGIPVIMDEGVCGIISDLIIEPGFTWFEAP